MRVVLRIFIASVLLAARANAFSLLGPYADWMQYTNGFRQHGDIGGPVNLGEEYRWNVPVVTYGFDQSFLDYFGSNGVAAVEQAIQILNDLPPASEIVLTNFPPDSRWVNWPAYADGLYDLKSVTLCLLVEQMGLAQPTRNVFVLRQWDPLFFNQPDEINWPTGAIPNLIIERNFDPGTFGISHCVNDTLYSGTVVSWWQHPLAPFPMKADVQEFAVDPFAWSYAAIADRHQSPALAGVYYTNLTRDDVGGIHYLLSTSNVNYESLLSDVSGDGTNASAYVNGALRPGVDKITFVRHPYESPFGQFIPLTNQFNDAYLTNGVLMKQQLKRVINQPDFLFRAADTSDGHWDGYADILGNWFARSDTSQWSNNAALNGNPMMSGPGVICSPVSVTFHKLGTHIRSVDSALYHFQDFRWGSFDLPTNPRVAYPDPPATDNQMAVHLWLHDQPNWPQPIEGGGFKLQVPVTNGEIAALQCSTNLSDWTTVFTVINRGAVVVWDNYCLGSPRFYRVVPQ